ncbi:hypothetical protein OAB57_02035 [Bacteriovoracaceae bacterium]|nr:hypothetical protein [Bacteriovoracaceae bacterium]
MNFKQSSAALLLSLLLTNVSASVEEANSFSCINTDRTLKIDYSDSSLSGDAAVRVVNESQILPMDRIYRGEELTYTATPMGKLVTVNAIRQNDGFGMRSVLSIPIVKVKVDTDQGPTRFSSIVITTMILNNVENKIIPEKYNYTDTLECVASFLTY